MRRVDELTFGDTGPDAPRPCPEFTCGECGRRMACLTEDEAPSPPLCGACRAMPGWHASPGLRAAIDPGGNATAPRVPQ